MQNILVMVVEGLRLVGRYSKLDLTMVEGLEKGTEYRS